MKIKTLICIDNMLRNVEELRLDALAKATMELREKEKAAGIDSWQVGDESIELCRKTKNEMQESLREIRLVRQDWNEKEWV